MRFHQHEHVAARGSWARQGSGFNHDAHGLRLVTIGCSRGSPTGLKRRTGGRCAPRGHCSGDSPAVCATGHGVCHGMKRWSGQSRAVSGWGSGVGTFCGFGKASCSAGALQNSRLRDYNARCGTDVAKRISQHVDVNRFDVSNLSSWFGEIMNTKRCLMVFVVVFIATSTWSNAKPIDAPIKNPSALQPRILAFPLTQGPIVAGIIGQGSGI